MEQVSANVGVSGAIVSAQVIENMRRPNVKHSQLEPAAFREPERDLRKPAEIDADMAAAFELLCEYWDAVRKAVQPGGDTWDDISSARRRWILPVFEALGYRPQYEAAKIAVDESGKLRFGLSHRAWEGAGPPYIHTVAPAQDLDQRAGERGSLAPHDEMQRYLNATQSQQWGIVTNGRRLRILRDFHHTSVRGYIEFDLDGIFETRDRADFRALYRLAHVSRLIRGDSGKTPLEYLYDESAAAGVAIGGKLRQNVRAAIEDLANGFLRGHPEVLQALQDDGERSAKAFYEEVLQVVYRMLFLLYAEQRGLLPGRSQLYQESYSISALRARAERPFRYDDPHGDLWEGLKVTFRLAKDGNDTLGVPKLGGELFGRGTEQFIDGMSCPNGVILTAIRHLALVEREGVLQRVSYVDLGVDELGSIYEALLDYQPRVANEAEDVPIDPDGKATRTVRVGEFFLDPRGMSRKSSGTYYTNPQLVDRLIQSALLPVLEERLAHAGEDPVAREAALLDLKVVDPACGSGAFLIAAMNTLGIKLASIRTGEDYPPADEVDHARHDVLARCIYGVDLNPTTVFLAKVSLWIAAAAKGEPLTFLDHRIRCGNSLVGATPELLEGGIPDEAFTPVTGDDKDFAKEVKKRTREERKAWSKGHGGIQPGLRVTLLETQLDLECYMKVGLLAAEDPAKAREIFDSCRESPETWSAHQVADTWTAAFFWPLDGSVGVPTEGLFRSLQQQHLGLPGRTEECVRQLAGDYRFFHWYLEFPDVFGREDPGFDVVLGNPPWDTVQPEELKFFEITLPEVAQAAGSRRKALIEALPETNPEVARKWEEYRRAIELLAAFGRESGRYPLTSFGKMNLYATFAELARYLVRADGRAGILVQGGIATDDSNKHFFADCARGRIVALSQFENRRKLFEGIDSRMQFCLLTLRGHPDSSVPGQYSFYCTEIDHLDEDDRRFALSAEDFDLFNPNTLTCPTFRSKRDADIARKMYQRAGVFWREARDGVPEDNPWGVAFQQMINMTSDSHLFRQQQQLIDAGFKLVGNIFRHPDGREYLPLYEAKLFHQYDHRFATFEGCTEDEIRSGNARELAPGAKADPATVVIPRYWVPAEEVVARLDTTQTGTQLRAEQSRAEQSRAEQSRAEQSRGLRSTRRWQLAFRDITNATNERTGLFSMIPYLGLGHTASLLHPLAGSSSSIETSSERPTSEQQSQASPASEQWRLTS